MRLMVAKIRYFCFSASRATHEHIITREVNQTKLSLNDYKFSGWWFQNYWAKSPSLTFRILEVKTGRNHDFCKYPVHLFSGYKKNVSIELIVVVTHPWSDSARCDSTDLLHISTWKLWKVASVFCPITENAMICDYIFNYFWKQVCYYPLQYYISSINSLK